MSSRDISGEGSAVGIDKFFKMAASVVKRAGKMVVSAAASRSSSKKRSARLGRP